MRFAPYLTCRQVKGSVGLGHAVVAIRLRHDAIDQPVVLCVGVDQRPEVEVAEDVPDANVRAPSSLPQTVQVVSEENNKINHEFAMTQGVH